MSLKDNYLKSTKNLGGPYSLTKKGIKRSVIGSILEGKDVRISNILKVTKALGITVEALVTGEAEKEHMVCEEPLTYLRNLQPFTDEEKKYLVKVLDILRGPNEQGKVALKTNIDTFHLTYTEKIEVQEDYTKDVRRKKKDCNEEDRGSDIKKQQAC